MTATLIETVESIDLTAPRVDLDLDKGATVTFLIVWREPSAPDGTPGPAIAFDGYIPRMQLRESYQASGFLVELTLGNGLTLTVNEDDEPAIRVRIGADITTALSQRSLYDFELTDAGDPTEVVRLMGGRVLASAEVTR